MATQVLRHRRCPANRPQPAPLPPPSPAKACRGTGDSAPCGRTSLPSPSAPSRGSQKNGRRNRSAPARSARLGGSSEPRRPVAAKSPGKKLVVEEVAFLKRGEPVKEPPAAVRDGDLALCSTVRLGPDPEILPKQTPLAGGEPSLDADLGFLASPSPSSLPFPASFFVKKDAGNGMDLATEGLRCLLRLDPP
ncbi:hypothetical protein Taro_047302 [Colocasia esculenta]|uniref:Uncharacterized protein n=1 Tax=Colocasia esculenta TaxID=4460 RepID=A0A843WUZ0_COLES|nr:hypothetical protein [Colocasia esculenta]